MAVTQKRERDIYRITIIGGVSNLLLTLFKFFAGIAGNSAAMLADAVHSLTDLVTDFMVLVFVRIAGKPSDKDHEYGHGKYETLATAMIGLLLLFVGAGICWNGLVAIYGWFNGFALESPEPVALWAALLSIVIKEVLYQLTAHVGRKCCSTATIANAWHHRSDAFSSVGTALGVGGAILLGENWRVLDPIAAVLVSAFIIRVSLLLMRPSVDELVEKSLSEDDESYIIKTILAEPGVSDPHNLRTRRIGNCCSIEVHFRMDGTITIEEAHRAACAIEEKLRSRFGRTAIINTHIEPVKPL